MKARKTAKKIQHVDANALPAAGSIVDLARKVAASRQRSLEMAKKAKIVTKSGQLSTHYK
jgi:hypothetical protein